MLHIFEDFSNFQTVLQRNCVTDVPCYTGLTCMQMTGHRKIQYVCEHALSLDHGFLFFFSSFIEI